MQNIRKFVTPIGIIYKKCATGPGLLATMKDRGANRKNKYQNVKLCMELFGKSFSDVQELL